MLRRLIVGIYGWIIEIFLWFVLLIAGIAGFLRVVPILKSAGWVFESEMAWRFFGAIVFSLAAFLAMAVAFGPILLLDDIRKSVRALEASSHGSTGSGTALSAEYKEPHL